MPAKTLIVQGGGFRTAFSAGVLDAFLDKQYNPFDFYIGVSGGAIAASYFVARQKRFCADAICFLSTNKQYMDMTRLLKAEAIIDVDVFYDISNKHMPFDFATATNTLAGKRMAIVMTNRLTGDPYYCQPEERNWREAIIASCAFPIISKGRHVIDGVEYMDGAWSDPLPVEWAVSQGAKDILIIRTSPPDEKIGKSWLDFMGEIYYRKSPGLKKAFAKNHEQYNRAIDFINDPPAGISIRQLYPDTHLKSGEFTRSTLLIEEDYRKGYSTGLNFEADESGNQIR